MRRAHILSLVLIIILAIASLSLLVSYTSQSINQISNQQSDPPYVGVSFCGNTTTQAKALIDRVKGYTNLFILHSGINPISTNESTAREICDYAVNAGLNIIINMGTWTRANWPWQIRFYNESKEKYSDKFLGAYYDDEPGGVPLDWNWTREFSLNSPYYGEGSPLDLTKIQAKLEEANETGISPDNYTEEAQWFNLLIKMNRGLTDLQRNNITTITSDYALYWFDYLAGYDTLLVQLGWNRSVNQEIALVRGAANMQNKDWGAIVTWKYTQSPFLDSAQEIYKQMETSFHAGAKYIIVFSYPQIGDDPYGGAMTDEHFQALEKFWTQVANKETPNSTNAEAALVLPKDYGWGMRKIDDKIWGFWGPDDKSPIIWNNAQTLMDQYGLRLDIIYDDPSFPFEGKYSKVYYWNRTI